MKHKITIESAIKAVNEAQVEIAGSFGNGSHKRLVARIVLIGNDTEIFYDLFDQRKCIATINSLPIAVDKYNELP